MAKESGGGIVYPAATLGVRLRLKEKGGGKETGDPSILKDYEQKYNEDHKDDIVCMAVDEPGNYAASGAVGKKPRIIVFKTDSLKTVSVLSGFHKRAVSQLAFSRAGSPWEISARK